MRPANVQTGLRFCDRFCDSFDRRHGALGFHGWHLFERDRVPRVVDQAALDTGAADIDSPKVGSFRLGRVDDFGHERIWCVWDVVDDWRSGPAPGRGRRCDWVSSKLGGPPFQ